MPDDRRLFAEDVLLIRFRPSEAAAEDARTGRRNPYPRAIVAGDNLEIIEPSTGRDLTNLIRKIEIVFDAEADQPLEAVITMMVDADMRFRALVLPAEDDDSE